MRLTENGTIGGVLLNSTITRTGNGHPAYEETLPVAGTGTLTGRTDANTGVATLSAGHGIVSTDVVDVYWAAGIRRGMVATVAVNAVSLEGGLGDDLPELTDPVKVSKVRVLDIDITGNTIILCRAVSQRRGSISIQQGDGTVIKSLDLGLEGGLDATNDGEGETVYATNRGMTNPFTGVSVGKVVVSNGSSAGTSRVAIGFEVNA